MLSYLLLIIIIATIIIVTMIDNNAFGFDKCFGFTFSNSVKNGTHRVPKFQLNIVRASWKKHFA